MYVPVTEYYKYVYTFIMFKAPVALPNNTISADNALQKACWVLILKVSWNIKMKM